MREAEAFQALAPWRWMHDSQILAVRLPRQGILGLCSVLGRRREVFGLSVARPPAGHRWLLDALFGDSPAVDDPDLGLDQDTMHFWYNEKKELSEQDRAWHVAACFKPKGRGSLYPAFRVQTPGGFPWHPTQAEAEDVLHALPRVAAFARLLRRAPDLHDLRQVGEVARFPDGEWSAGRELMPAMLTWEPIVRPPEDPPEPAVMEEATEATLMALPSRTGAHFEVDVFYMQWPVVEDRIPFFPKGAMVVERASGIVLGIKFGGRSVQANAKNLGEVLAGALRTAGFRPETFRVRRESVGRMLTGLATRLGIEVCLEQNLSELNRARGELAKTFPPG